MMKITPATDVDIREGELVAIRYAFGPAFESLALSNDQLIAVTADLGGSVNLSKFGESHPNRYFNCGVAEENMIGICAGLAIIGYLPFAITFGAFLGRSMDHIRQSVGHNKLKVNVVGSHGGISNGKDGPSAHAIEDLAMFRAMPSFAVVVIADAQQLAVALQSSVEYPGSVYLRLYREPTPMAYKANPPFELGRVNVLKEGRDVTLLACGPHVAYCLRWASAWERDVSVEVIDCHTIHPLDEEGILKSVSKTGRVVTVEDHLITGGLGSAVSEFLSEVRPTPVRRVGLRGYATSGPYYSLLDHVGIGEEGVRLAIEQLLDMSVTADIG